jgi:hypothetical protein
MSGSKELPTWHEPPFRLIKSAKPKFTAFLGARGPDHARSLILPGSWFLAALWGMCTQRRWGSSWGKLLPFQLLTAIAQS